MASIKEQIIIRFLNGKSVKHYQMSSSKRPPSCKENSFGTPVGLHELSEKIGDGEPSGMVFKGRKPIGKTYWECTCEERRKNLITSRILRLVYLHGTNHESNLGVPVSSGCLQVSNSDAIELHDLMPLKTHIFIEKV